MLFTVGIGSLVNAQTKKVIIEDYTGTWCGWCPEGTVILENLKASNPTNLITIANHNGDALQTAEGAAIDAGLNVTAYPNGSIDRKLFSGEAKTSVSRSKWGSYFAQQAANTAIVSVSFDNTVYDPSSDTYSADVNVEFTGSPTSGVPVNIQVYILEDSIAATGSYAQSNYSSAVQSGASPLTNWYHNSTLRDALGGDWGFANVIPTVPSPTLNTVYTQNISFSLDPSWVKSQIHLVAFVAYNGDVASGQKEILNAEETSLAYFYPTGVNDANINISVLGAYPNPAAASDIVKVEYDLNESGKVNLNVYNFMGQKVAVPYATYETQGKHTMNWRAADFGLAAGMYMLEVATEKGDKQTTRVIIK